MLENSNGCSFSLIIQIKIFFPHKSCEFSSDVVSIVNLWRKTLHRDYTYKAFCSGEHYLYVILSVLFAHRMFYIHYKCIFGKAWLPHDPIYCGFQYFPSLKNSYCNGYIWRPWFSFVLLSFGYLIFAFGKMIFVLNELF